ncbi:MAG: hypothetical protein SNJ71_06895 [Bacteroidales bacterium]
MTKNILISKKILEYTWLVIAIAAIVGLAFNLIYGLKNKDTLILIAISAFATLMYIYRRKNRIEFQKKQHS